MCGVTGIFAFNEDGERSFNQVPNALEKLAKRGPDNTGQFQDQTVCLGQTRLTIIDTSAKGNQPFHDPSGRYVLVFNGEIYNYRELRADLEKDGIQFISESDTEVLLHLLIKLGEQALPQLNGFFAFALYDRQERSLFLARDRMGIKPLLYYKDSDKFIFASEMKALLAYGQERKIREVALSTYFALNYIPAPYTILENHFKLQPGQAMFVSGNEVRTSFWWVLPAHNGSDGTTYKQAQKKLRELLELSVSRRMVADVPLGTFLSGGIDSSIISTIAASQTNDLHTFSLGFKDAPYFDETQYAEAVARKIKSNHTTFSITLDDLYQQLEDTIEYLDEPFADSSCLAVNILSKYTRQHVKVALSGDGADELFSGYNKHSAELRSRQTGFSNSLIKSTLPFWKLFPQSRNSTAGNKFRQLVRYGEGLKLDDQERYWRWASILDGKSVSELLQLEYPTKEIEQVKAKYLNGVTTSFNSVLTTDLKLVLPNDMLNKVDLMSMSQGLEVRTPFLDHELVNFVQKLPSRFKINASIRKRILQETYRQDLPEELFNRPKKGFEVPLNQWFKSALRDRLENRLLEPGFIQEQGIFEVKATEALKRKLFSSNPGDSTATGWALYVFQEWWLRYMN